MSDPFTSNIETKAVPMIVNEPKVSIIIAAHNAELTIKRAVTSALAEKEILDVIVVDDASTDNTIQVAKLADDGSSRLKILSLPQNRGPSAARNLALKECRATWVGILDSDDFFLPGRLTGLLRYSDEADFIADDIWRVSEHDIDGPKTLFLGAQLSGPRFVDFTEFIRSNITKRGRQREELGFIKPIMRKSFIDKHKLSYQENMRLGEDYELYARALGVGARLLLVPAQGYVSVVRARSLSGAHSENDLLQLRDCDLSLKKLPHLKKSDRRSLRHHYLSIDCRLQWRLLILAVKERNFKKAAVTFLRPWPVQTYLLRQLFEQLWLRVGKKIRS